MIRRRHRHRQASDIPGCQVDTCDGSLDAAATFGFLFATLRGTISGSVQAIRVPEKQEDRTLIRRFLQLVQPALDLLCDRRGFEVVAGISSYTGVVSMC
jgi:hypothetical protein